MFIDRAQKSKEEAGAGWTRALKPNPMQELIQRLLSYLPGASRAAPKVTVLCYHGIQPLAEPGGLAPFLVSPENFESQLDTLLAAGYSFIGPADFLAFHRGQKIFPPKTILLTFDDGFADLESFVLPRLLARNLPAIAFVVTERLGQTNLWDVERGAPAVPLLDVEGLRRIAAQGMAIAAHTRTHPRLRGLDDEALDAEIAGSENDLQRLGFPTLGLFAYPFGANDRRVRNGAKRSGMAIGFTIKAGSARARGNAFSVPRIMVAGTDDAATLMRRITN